MDPFGDCAQHIRNGCGMHKLYSMTVLPLSGNTLQAMPLFQESASEKEPRNPDLVRVAQPPVLSAKLLRRSPAFGFYSQCPLSQLDFLILLCPGSQIQARLGCPPFCGRTGFAFRFVLSRAPQEPALDTPFCILLMLTDFFHACCVRLGAQDRGSDAART